MSMTIGELQILKAVTNYAMTAATLNNMTNPEARAAIARAYVIVEREIKLRITSPVTGLEMCPECGMSKEHANICSQGRD